MKRWTLALGLAALALGGVSCRSDDTTGPDDNALVRAKTDPALELAGSALSFRQISAGGLHTCGVTTQNVAYCWGGGSYGQLGDGGTPFSRNRPYPVQGGLRFRMVSAGLTHTCGVTPENLAYCWGQNDYGQIGDGSVASSSFPVAVAGGRQFRQIDAGNFYTCALSYPDRRAYCWGINAYGQLGDGSTTDSRTPVAVQGGRAFRWVSAGGSHTCAVTPTYAAYCWGYNRFGQLGDGTEVSQRSQPTLVAGAREFVQIDAGRNHTCAVTRSERGFCWGYGRDGEIGDGKTYLRFTPRAVAGGLSFSRLTAGGTHTCGETTGNRAYCWGVNNYGTLGDGTTTSRLTPRAVAGGLSFAQVSAGEIHTCGMTTGARAYCWGHNGWGQLGDGTYTNRSRPVAVADPM